MWVHVTTALKAVLTSTHNLCFRAKIRKHAYMYSCKPQFYYIKVGCKRVNITRTCYPDVMNCHEKFYVLVFRPGKTQTCSDSLERIDTALKFGYRSHRYYMVLVVISLIISKVQPRDLQVCNKLALTFFRLSPNLCLTMDHHYRGGFLMKSKSIMRTEISIVLHV